MGDQAGIVPKNAPADEGDAKQYDGRGKRMLDSRLDLELFGEEDGFESSPLPNGNDEEPKSPKTA